MIELRSGDGTGTGTADRHARLILITFMLAACLAPAGTASAAQILYKQDSPDFYQINAAYNNNGENFCVPTATADGVVWLQGHGFGRLPDATSETQIVNDLAGLMMTDQGKAGTYMSDAVTGIQTYLERSAHYPGQVVVQSVGIDADGVAPDQTDYNWVAGQLAQTDTAVVVTGMIYWRLKADLPYGSGDWGDWTAYGGHAVFLVGYDDSATISYCHDPDDGSTKALRTYPLNWTGGYYLIEGADLPTIDPGLPSAANAEVEVELRWDDAMSYQITPEPMTLSLLAVGGLFLPLCRRRRCGALKRT
ncbi:MAG TPA: PEP-CTERM sorting domain-containing protein [Planctomycetota bacterium]|nr:PEP-CTERM sorting domain-containing protein [Planctomycetota bacterium]